MLTSDVLTRWRQHRAQLAAAERAAPAPSHPRQQQQDDGAWAGRSTPLPDWAWDGAAAGPSGSLRLKLAGTLRSGAGGGGVALPAALPQATCSPVPKAAAAAADATSSPPGQRHHEAQPGPAGAALPAGACVHLATAMLLCMAAAYQALAAQPAAASTAAVAQGSRVAASEHGALAQDKAEAPQPVSACGATAAHAAPAVPAGDSGGARAAATLLSQQQASVAHVAFTPCPAAVGLATCTSPPATTAAASPVIQCGNRCIPPYPHQPYSACLMHALPLCI